MFMVIFVNDIGKPKGILSLVRIPISPLRHELKMIELFGLARQDAKFVFRRSMPVYAAPPEFERKRLREILFMC
jgi:hypothetical protein